MKSSQTITGNSTKSNEKNYNFKLPPRPRIKKLPAILSVEEVKRLFEAAANLKHRVLLALGVAAVLSRKITTPGKKTGIILSGGNIDAKTMKLILDS